MDTTPKAVKDKKEQSYDVISDHVDESINQLTLSALSSAIGDIRVFKLSITGKGSVKYVPVTTPEETILALEYIGRFSNTIITPAALEQNEQDYSYFMLQQGAVNMTAWNSLIDRRLGKIPQEAKLEATIQYDLVRAGMNAYEQQSKQLPSQTPTYTIPKIHST